MKRSDTTWKPVTLSFKDLLPLRCLSRLKHCNLEFNLSFTSSSLLHPPSLHDSAPCLYSDSYARSHTNLMSYTERRTRLGIRLNFGNLGMKNGISNPVYACPAKLRLPIPNLCSLRQKERRLRESYFTFSKGNIGAVPDRFITKLLEVRVLNTRLD